MRKYREYTDEDIIKHAKEVKSIAALLRKLDLRPAGGNYANIKSKLQKLDVDCSHWTGKGWRKGQRLKEWVNYSKASRLKPHLIKEKGHICELCKLSDWRGSEIPLEIHHKNGNRTDNRLDNLQLLCCNCHALTDNWRNKKRNVKKRGDVVGATVLT